MAIKVPVQSGLWSNAATWGTSILTGSALGASTVTLAGSDAFSETFTAAGLDTALCAVFYLQFINGSAPFNSTFSVTLQEFNGSTWSDKATVTLDSVNLLNSYSNYANITASGFFNSWVQARFTAPYAYTTTSTGYYRIKFTRVSGSHTFSIGNSSSSSGSAFCIAVDNRTGAPGSTDTIIVTGYGTTRIDLEVDGTVACGNGGTDAFSAQNTTDAIQVSTLGNLKFDTAAAVTLTCKNRLRVAYGGRLIIGESADKIPIANPVIIHFDNDTPAANCGITMAPRSQFFSDTVLQSGYLETTVSSGVGTAANPVIFSNPVDWSVGDYLAFTPGTNSSTNYNEVEYKYIKTKNSSTSYVLSDTAGGSESALTFSHGSAPVLKLTRSIIIDSLSSNAFRGSDHTFTTSHINDSAIQGVQFTKTNSVTLTSGNNQFIDVRYCSFHHPLSTSNTVLSIGDLGPGTLIRDCMIARPGTSASNAFSTSASVGLVINKLYIVDAQNNGASLYCPLGDITALKAFACNKSGSTSSAAFVLTNSNFDAQFKNCEVHASRNPIAGSSPSCGTWVNLLSGSLAKNSGARHYANINSVAAQIIFENPTFESSLTDIALSTTGANIGASVGIQKYNTAANDHRFWTSFGFGRSTGSGLADTTVRTASSFALRLEPASGVAQMPYRFKVTARANKAVSVIGFGKKNATLQNFAVTLNLYLPGSVTPDDTFTIPNDTNFNLWGLTANYTGSSDRYATVEVLITSPATTGGYFYLDDLFNGTNPITALDLWDNGQPSPVMFEQLGDPAAVWAVSSDNIAEGTMAEFLRKIDRKVDDTQALVFVR